MIAAIPTKWKGIEFRSRLEATWACFFDLAQWPWQYEPIDLLGYIPDFVLAFPRGPILVEVKPSFTLAEMLEHTGKIENSGWEHEALIVGTAVHMSSEFEDMCAIGMHAERPRKQQGLPVPEFFGPPLTWSWNEGLLTTCSDGGAGIANSIGSYTCRRCGSNDGNPDGVSFDLGRGLFAKAKNQMQWRPHRKWRS